MIRRALLCIAYHVYHWLPPACTSWGRLHRLRKWAGEYRK